MTRGTDFPDLVDAALMADSLSKATAAADYAD
jgi:hypothetical protein